MNNYSDRYRSSQMYDRYIKANMMKPQCIVQKRLEIKKMEGMKQERVTNEGQSSF